MRKTISRRRSMELSASATAATIAASAAYQTFFRLDSGQVGAFYVQLRDNTDQSALTRLASDSTSTVTTTTSSSTSTDTNTLTTPTKIFPVMHQLSDLSSSFNYSFVPLSIAVPQLML